MWYESVKKVAMIALTCLVVLVSSGFAGQERAATGDAVAPRIAVEKAPAPLYDDPVWHGASDPAVVWLPGKGEHGQYWMYYTQRRATLSNPNGVDWVHGSAIGIATSPDGLHWTYAGVARGTIKDGDAEKSLGEPLKDGITWWAPTVFWEGGNGITGGGRPGDRLHMFVSYVHGIFTSWTGDRTIEHFVSTDGVNWTHVSLLGLASRRAIDPTVHRIGDTWYLWYKNEAAGSRTFRASSEDLITWQDDGDADIGRGHEAAFVWRWKGAYWNLHDNGRGLDAWRSENGLSDWTLNTVLLTQADTGQRPLDRGPGHHPWIVLQAPASGPAQPGDEQLVLFYFAHDGSKTYMQMAEITLGDDGKLACDRNKYAAPAQSAWHTIHNDFYWVDQNGARVLTRSGCLCKFDGLYYWYGGSQAGRFREQYCYTSTDLVHWTSKGAVLSHDVEANRIDVVYNKATKQYVMVMKYDGNGAHLGIATADKPEGPFTFKSRTLVDNARMGDSSVYVEDGKAYLCYVSWAVGTNAQHGIYLMSPDYLSLDKRICLWDIRSREAPHIFKRNGIYYYGTSRTAGIESSGTSYYTAKDLAGPWSPATPLSTPGSTNSWDSQVDMVIPIQGTEGTVYLYFGDRWIKNLPQGRNGDYIFLPIELDGDTPILNYYQDWEINLTAGAWRRFDPARNLAAGKGVTASSESGTNLAKHVTSPKTYQDYVNTYWQSSDGDTQWIMVDLEKPTEINRVILKWNTNAAKEFKVQTSTDATNWTDVFTTNLGSSYTVTDETFKTTTARYVRAYMTQKAPIPRGRGGRTGRGSARSGAGAVQPAAEATQPPTTTQPPTPPATAASRGEPGSAGSVPTPTGYSLFDFMVLKD